MSQAYVPKLDGVDMIAIKENFDKARENDPGLEITSYIEAFQELARFFDLMGTLFATMASDIREQIKVLERLLQSGERDNYTTIEKMIKYEKADAEHRLESPLGKRKSDQSGSRTVLHLNRTLDFFRQFLGKMSAAGDEEKLPGICSPVYKETLGKHHSWLLSKAAGIAISTLPTKLGLYEKVSKYPYQQTTDALLPMVTSMNTIYQVTDELFTKYELQKLPF